MGMQALELELEQSDSAYDEEEEAIGLITNKGWDFGNRAAPIEPKDPTSRRGRRWQVFAMLAFASLLVFHWKPNIKHDSEDKYKQKYDGSPHYTCPAQLDNQENNDSQKDLDRKYKELCKAKDDEGMKQNRLAQQRQNDWYGHWVAEMVKIAKPGAPVIIEQVSYPLCEAFFDWGGVKQSFWQQGHKNYGWDIDPASIDFEKDEIYRKRYHVFMRKNNANGNSTRRVYDV